MMMKNLLTAVCVCWLLVLTAPCHATRQHILIPGTGDSQELLHSLAHVFMQQHREIMVEIPASTGSGGGIKSLLAGNCPLARVARPLKERERRHGLTSRIFARTPVVFAVHPSVQGIDTLTYRQIIDIYSGKITHWGQLGGTPDSKIYIANRESGDSSRRVLEALIPGFKSIRNYAGEIIYTTPETVSILRTSPYTIGYLPLSATVDTSLKVLAINKVSPSLENVDSGRYPLVVSLALVWKGELQGAEKSFVDFLLSQQGQRIIIEYGAYPVQ